MKRLIIAQRIAEGEAIPKGYGIAYLEDYGAIAVCYPFSLNHFIAWIRCGWLKVRNAKADFVTKAYWEGYQKGYDCGMIDGLTRRTLLESKNPS